MFSFLPQFIKDALKRIGTVNEIRIRSEKPVVVAVDGLYRYLSVNGFTDNPKFALKISAEDVENIVFAAGNYSVYSVIEQAKRGYITTDKGVRIGLCGEYVIENEKIITIKNITSLNIRVPREVIGCSDFLYENFLKENLKSILILSACGMGKTTLLRDLSRNIGCNSLLNTLIIDERGEIAVRSQYGGLNVGNCTDVISFCPKNIAFEAAIRSMRPDLLITDELSAEDITALKRAKNAGIKTFASCHFDDIEKLKNDTEFSKIISENIFDLFVVLSREKIGVIDDVFNDKLMSEYSRN